MRTLTKSWRNGRGGRWTRRVCWLDDSESIRLEFVCLSTSGSTKRSLMFQASKSQAADAAWDLFKLGENPWELIDEC